MGGGARPLMPPGHQDVAGYAGEEQVVQWGHGQQQAYGGGYSGGLASVQEDGVAMGPEPSRGRREQAAGSTHCTGGTVHICESSTHLGV